MALYDASTLIRELRMSRGFTQAQLAEGICSTQAIYLIEKGERRPNWNTFADIMIRLGVDPKVYHADYIVGDDALAHEMNVKFGALIRSFDFDGLKALYEECEQDPRFNAPDAGEACRRFFYDLAAKCFAQGPHADEPRAIENALAYLRLMRPDFDFDKISEYLLSDTEMALLNTISIAYSSMQDLDNSIHLKMMIKDNIKKQHLLGADYIKRYKDYLRNLAKNLLHAKRYEEALALVEEGIALCTSLEDTAIYMMFLDYKSHCLIYMGRKEEGDALQKRVIHFVYAVDGFIFFNLADAKSDFEELQGYKLSDLSLEW